MFGRAKVGDGSIYNGVWTTYSGRLAGPVLGSGVRVRLGRPEDAAGATGGGVTGRGASGGGMTGSGATGGVVIGRGIAGA